MSLTSAFRVITGVGRRPLRPAPSEGPLRIAMTIESVLLGGAEVVMLQLSEELRRRGHTVFPIGPGDREGWLSAKVREVGFEWHTYPLRSPVDFGCAEAMARMFTAMRADVVHGHEFTTSVYGAAGARLAGIPHVMSMHGNQKMLEARQRRVALRWAMGISQATVAVSGDTKTHLEQGLGLRPGSVTVVRNGIPDRRGAAAGVRAELGVGEQDLMVLAIGSLMKRKGHRVLLEAMCRLDAAGFSPRWKIAIAGEGAERADLEAFITDRGLTGRAILLGNRDDVPDLQAAADVFAMPSLWEGLPLAVLEAMFAANPVIATTASGIPEAITHDESGLLIPPGDPDALASALRRLLSDAALRTRLGAQARARAERDFSIGAMADGYERLYRSRPAR
jgi:glycosyltransferase involved in cell wall biosynthesis